MKKIRTLKKNYEFKNVLNNRKFYSGKQITIYINRNKLNENVIGIAVSSKSGKAVRRNHVKRLIRENYYNKKIQLKRGYSIVFVWNRKIDIKNANYHVIESDMEKIFEKLKILNKDEKNK